MSLDALHWFDEIAAVETVRSTCIRHLEAYFSSEEGVPAFSGARFESFGENPWNRITADDLIAVSMLSVRVPGQAALRFLERSAGAITELLVRIPTELDLHEAAAAPHVARGSAADELWALLRSSSCRADRAGAGQVTTSKLLARKRPRLLPVWDGIVGGQLGLSGPETHWQLVHEWLAGDERRVETLRALRDEAGVPAHISELRVLDVVLWMRGKDENAEREQRAPSSL